MLVKIRIEKWREFYKNNFSEKNPPKRLFLALLYFLNDLKRFP
jgi:hypothetical protein